MPIYVLLKKHREEGIVLPYFEVLTELPELIDHARPNRPLKLITLELGECVDVARFFLSDNQFYYVVEECRISNIDGEAQEEIIQAYTLGRFGK
jgi:hypothetical protein